MTKNIYIAATGQSDGKTTLSIGLYNYFNHIGKNVGFIKPVGQRYVLLDDVQIDKDSYLIDNIYQSDIDIKLTSPIAIPHGYTEDYILHREDKRHVIEERLMKSYNEIAKDKELVIIEGTGHAGVGACLDLSNARVAKMLGAKVILIAPGGIGNTIDEVMLNKALFDQEGVEVMGVVVNKVFEDKFEKVKFLLTKAFKDFNIPILGFIPYRYDLSSPNMWVLRESLKAEILNEGQNPYQNIADVVVGAMTPHYVLSYLKKGSLLITPGDREDLLLAALSLSMLSAENRLAGILLTGGILPRENVANLLRKSDIPVYHVLHDTYETAKKVSKLNVKITINDKKKIETAKELIDEYVDKDYILKNL